MATTTTMSGAAFDQLPYEEGRRFELIQGELIEVSSATPEHQLIVTILIVALYNFFRGQPGGRVIADSEFILGEDERIRPDVAVLLAERWAAVDRNKTPIPVPPDIAIEIISPSEKTTDSDRKVWTYLKAGTSEVWQIHPKSQKVVIYRSAKSIIALAIGENLTSPLLPGWEMPVSEIFGA